MLYCRVFRLSLQSSNSLGGHISGIRHPTASLLRIKSCLSLEVSSKPNLNDRLVVFGYYLRDHPELLIAIGVFAAGLIISAIMLSIDPNFLKYYGDAVSH